MKECYNYSYRRFIIFFLACWISEVHAQLPDYVPINGLVAWYPFNGNANDESGHGNNGTVNGATAAQDRFGNTNAAFHFDGATSYVIGSCTNFPSTARTVSLWFNASNIAATRAKGVFGYGGGVCGTSWLEIVDATLYRVSMHCSDNWSSYYNGVIENAIWHHWVVTTDGVSQAKFYLDGQVVLDTTTFYNNTFTSAKDFIIGGIPSPGGSGYYSDPKVAGLDGIVDDVGIWNRVLTAQEVQGLFRTYVFIGTGDWNMSSNWLNNLPPPAVLQANYQIWIKPEGNSECILSSTQTISQGSSIVVYPGKKFRVVGNLIIQ